MTIVSRDAWAARWKKKSHSLHKADPARSPALQQAFFLSPAPYKLHMRTVTQVSLFIAYTLHFLHHKKFIHRALLPNFKMIHSHSLFTCLGRTNLSLLPN